MATKQVQWRRGTTAQHASVAGAVGEITVDTTKKVPVTHDGVTPGGIPAAREDHVHRHTGLAINGLTIQNDAASYLNTINVLPGSCRDTTNTYDIVLPATLSKHVVGLFTAGSGAGGLDAGSVAANSTYHVHVIKRLSDGAVDVLLSTSPNNPVMPSGFTVRRRIGAILTDSSAAIRKFLQVPGTGDFFLKEAVASASAAPNAALTLRALAVPLGIKVKARINCTVAGNASGGYVGITDPDLGTPNLTAMYDFYRTTPSATINTEVWTNASQQIYTWDTYSGTTISILVRGWFDPRI